MPGPRLEPVTVSPLVPAQNVCARCGTDFPTLRPDVALYCSGACKIDLYRYPEELSERYQELTVGYRHG